jgi:putative mRNA 3-end processing factor
MADFLMVTDRGLYCPAGEFYVDPVKPVDRALITHAHSDHARPGSSAYLTAAAGVDLLQLRLGRKALVQGMNFGEPVDVRGVRVSFHPSGHLLGAAQIRLESKGEVWVVSGDYKLAPDRTCAAFEPVRCHTFITESTFGLPIYRWLPTEVIMAEIHAWWREQTERGRACVLLAYSLGKAQRLLAGLDATIGPIIIHANIAEAVEVYQKAGVKFPRSQVMIKHQIEPLPAGCLAIIPPIAGRQTDQPEFQGSPAVGMVSGWMQVRGMRRSPGAYGFALSDHADWPGLNEAIKATQAARVLVTHGFTEVMVRWLRENGADASALQDHQVAIDHSASVSP